MSAPAPRAVLAGTVTGVLVGAAMVATRHVVHDVGPLTLALLRYAIGALGPLPWVLASRRVAVPPRDLAAIGLLGIGQFAILIALLNIGLQSVGAGLGALLFATLPLMTMVLASLLGREDFTWAKLAGIGLTIAGVALAVGGDLASGGSAGIALVLASALVGAVCAVFYRDYVARYPPLQVCLLAMLASVAALAPAALVEVLVLGPPRFSGTGWLAVGFIGLASSIGYFTWLYAFKHATPTRACLFLALGPVTAGLLGAALLGEPLAWGFLASLPLVIGGLWLAHLPARRPRVRPS